MGIEFNGIGLDMLVLKVLEGISILLENESTLCGGEKSMFTRLGTTIKLIELTNC